MWRKTLQTKKDTNMKKHFGIIFCCALITLLSVRGFASGFSPTSITDSLAPYDLTSAWDFQITQSFRVTALDYYDSGTPGGLLTSHQVGLWTSNGVLLASVTIPAGTAAPQIGDYRSEAITPIILTPGFYEVGGFVPGSSDKYVIDATGNTLSGILYQESHVATGAFAFAGSQNLISGKEITANFEASAVSDVPEPGTAGLLFAGIVGLVLFWRKRTRGRRRIFSEPVTQCSTAIA
jgi:hypothetical protein